ncbi:hypothetical protein SDC9_148365 [bioreactor metagenome]|uniref:Uncharacterized protein n=1 Tax=bioreactor metagenome TaxID=1076179 RepID=A0A645EJ40_9ZZZZ
MRQQQRNEGSDVFVGHDLFGHLKITIQFLELAAQHLLDLGLGPARDAQNHQFGSGLARNAADDRPAVDSGRPGAGVLQPDRAVRLFFGGKQLIALSQRHLFR